MSRLLHYMQVLWNMQGGQIKTGTFYYTVGKYLDDVCWDVRACIDNYYTKPDYDPNGVKQIEGDEVK